MRRIKTIEVVASDLTKNEIKEGGWELGGLRTSAELHFHSLTDLLEFFITGRYKDTSENYFVTELRRRGIYVEVRP